MDVKRITMFVRDEDKLEQDEIKKMSRAEIKMKVDKARADVSSKMISRLNKVSMESIIKDSKSAGGRKS
ncbi:MAG: hypothetical protein LBD94_03375 [Rickettsiales bacterium]|jgi:hypothetical protein|nr:hypothetical protein [Rickettsiales bacterium]